jgi:flagellar basal body-associated protein FliL
MTQKKRQKKNLQSLIQQEDVLLRQLLLDKSHIMKVKNDKLQIIHEKQDSLSVELQENYNHYIMDRTLYISVSLEAIKNLQAEVALLDEKIADILIKIIETKTEQEIKMKAIENINQQEKKLAEREEQKELDRLALQTSSK